MTITADVQQKNVNELPSHLRAVFALRSQKLQMLPAVAVKALAIARDPDCSIREFVSVVERDTKLASDILSMSNSPLFFTGGPAIVSLQQSVSRLGFLQCRNLILSTSMAAMMKSMTLEEEWVREVLSNHAYLTGSLAIQVNRILGAGFQGEEYAAGLIHDFGRALLAVCLPEQFAAADPLTFDESSETLVHENIRLGTNHCHAGAWFADANGLPQEFITVIQHHHTPASAVKYRRLVALTAVCDHMANHLQRHQCGDEYDIKANHAVFVLESCGVQNAAGRLEEMWSEIMRNALQMAQESCSF